MAFSRESAEEFLRKREPEMRLKTVDDALQEMREILEMHASLWL